MNQKKPPPKKMTEAEFLAQGRRDSAAIRGQPETERAMKAILEPDPHLEGIMARIQNPEQDLPTTPPDTVAVPRELLVRISDALWDGLIPDVAEEVDVLLGRKQ